jgi:hypothetical protein
MVGKHEEERYIERPRNIWKILLKSIVSNKLTI